MTAVAQGAEVSLVSKQLQDWFTGLKTPLFQEPRRAAAGKARSAGRSATLQMLASLAPGLSHEERDQLYLAVRSLAEASGSPAASLESLQHVVARPLKLPALPAAAHLRRHNAELKVKLELMAALPAPTALTHSGDVPGLRRLLNLLPDPVVGQLAASWLPPGLFGISDAREALCFLHPVPRSLLRLARQLVWEAAPSQARDVGQGASSAGELRRDYLVLKVLQCITAVDAAINSPDGPELWRNRRDDAERRLRPGSWHGLLKRDTQTPAVWQSTATEETLGRLHGLYRDAVLCPQRSTEANGHHADLLVPAWVCAACLVAPLEPVLHYVELLPSRPLCTCVGVRWSWRDLEDGSPGVLERRAWRRCLWWAQELSNKRKPNIEVFDVLEHLWLAEIATRGMRSTPRLPA